VFLIQRSSAIYSLIHQKFIYLLNQHGAY